MSEEPMTRDRYLKELGNIHRKWAAKADKGIKPDPKYSKNEESQYPETAVDMSASREDEAAYWIAVKKLNKKRNAWLESQAESSTEESDEDVEEITEEEG